jgi:hypothetical protein
LHVLALLPLLTLARAQDEELSYEGNLSARAADYAVGKPLTISHSGGNVEVRCVDGERLAASASYTVSGTKEGPMEAFGKGVGLSAGAGVVRTRVPTKPAGVTEAEVTLKVTVPRTPSALTVTQTGAGWVQIIGCGGALKVSGGSRGAYASGAFTGVNASASGGDVRVVVEGEAPLSGPSSVSAPAGAATLEFPRAQGGKLAARGAEVEVAPLVLGTVGPTLVQGDLTGKGPQITVSAKGKATVKIAGP